MGHEVSMELYAYWNALRAGRPAPERNDVEPGAIRSVLADTFVLEYDAGIGFPFRISGSRVNALFQRELRGLSFLKLWREADRREIDSVLRRVADKAEPCLLGAEAKPVGMGPLPIEVTLLPLCHHGSTHSRVLGSVVAETGSDWLGFVGAGAATLTSVKALGSDAPRNGRAISTIAASAQRTRSRRLFLFLVGRAGRAVADFRRRGLAPAEERQSLAREVGTLAVDSLQPGGEAPPLLDIVLGGAAERLRRGGVERAGRLGRRADDQRVVGKDLVLRDQRPRPDEAAAADSRSVEHDRAHSDQRAVADPAAM